MVRTLSILGLVWICGASTPASAQTTSNLLQSYDRILLCRIERFDEATRLVRCSTVKAIKGDAKSEFILKCYYFDWCARGREFIWFERGSDATLCVGPDWHPFEWIQDSWKSKRIYRRTHVQPVGPANLLAPLIEDWVCGKEVALPVKMRYRGYGPAEDLDGPNGRIVRVKTPAANPEFPPVQSDQIVGRGFDPAWAAKIAPALHSDDPWVRAHAVMDLMSCGPAAAAHIDELWRRFTDPDPYVRVLAAEACMLIEPSETIPLLVLGLELKSQNPKSRQLALERIGKLASKASPMAELLLEALSTETDEDALVSLVRSIASVVPHAPEATRKRVIQMLVQLPSRPGTKRDSDLLAATFIAVRAFGNELIPVMPQIRKQLCKLGENGPFDLVARFDPDAVAVFHQVLEDRPDLAKSIWKVVDLLGRDADGVQHLLSVLSKYYVREPAYVSARANAHMTSSKAERFLWVNQLASNDEELVSTALTRLGLAGATARDVAPGIWRLLRDEKSPVSHARLVQLLWRIEIPDQHGQLQRDVRPELVRALGESLKTHDRENALWTARIMGPWAEPLIPLIVPCLKERDLRIYALRALKEIGPASARAGIPALLPLLEDIDRHSQVEAIAAGLRISPGHKLFMAGLLKQIDEEGNWDILVYLDPKDVTGKTLVPYLVRGLRHRDNDVYRYCARLLKAIDPQRAKKEGVR